MPEDNCPKITFYAPSGKLGGDKPIPSCIPPVVKVPEVLYRPEGVEETEPSLLVPRPIEIINTNQVASCESVGKEGSELVNPNEVVVPAGTFRALIVFDSVPGIQRSALDYIATHGYEADIEELLRTGNLEVEYLVKLGLTKTQSEEFIELAEDTIAMLNKSAMTMSESLLECIWWNDAVTAKCPEGAATAEQHPDAVWSFTVQAHTISSHISKADANKQAQIIAEAAINCLYLSYPVTADCVTRPDAPEPGLAPVPNDESPVYEGLTPRRGTVELPEGAVVSSISRADATAQAQELAYSQLVCYYINDEVVERCLTPNGEFATDARNQGVDPSTSESITITLPSQGRTGQTVIVPEGYITSELSSALATEEAKILAQSLLECCYMNEEIVLECPPYQYIVYDEETGVPISKEIPATKITNDPNEYSITIPKGYIISCTSQDDVTAQAEAIAESSLICNYCNVKVLPVCVPEWVRTAADRGIILTQPARVPVWNPVTNSYVYKDLNAGDVYTISLPLNQEIYYNPVTHAEESVTTWSEDATIGAAEGEFCGSSYEQSQQVADSTSELQVSIIYKKTRDNCTYTNDLLVAGCNFIDPYDNSASSGELKVQYLKKQNAETGEFYFLYRDNIDPKLEGIDGREYNGLDPKSFSSPEIGSYVTIPAGTISITAEDVPSDYTGPSDIHTETWEDKTDDEGNPLPPEPGTVPYPGLSGDLAETQRIKSYANVLALEMAKTMINCVYINYYMSASCNDNAVQMSPLAIEGGEQSWDVPAGSFKGPIFNDVIDAAVAALGSGPVCLYPNVDWSCTKGCAPCGSPPDNIVITKLTIDNPLPENYVIPAGTFYAETPAKANEQAAAMCEHLLSVSKCSYTLETEASVNCTAACDATAISLTDLDKINYSWLELNEEAGDIQNDKLIVTTENGMGGAATCSALYISVSALCKAKCEAVAQIAFKNKIMKGLKCTKNPNRTWDLDKIFVGSKEEVKAMVELYETSQCAEAGVACGDNAFDVCTKEEEVKTIVDGTEDMETQYFIRIITGRVNLPNNCYIEIPTQPEEGTGDDEATKNYKKYTPSGVKESVKLNITSSDAINFTWKYTLGEQLLFQGTSTVESYSKTESSGGSESSSEA